MLISSIFRGRNTMLWFCREIRECLKLDPEHKNCFPHYKKVKKIDKLMTDSEEHITSKSYGLCAEKAKKVSWQVVKISAHFGTYSQQYESSLFQIADITSRKGRTYDHVFS